MENNDKSTMDGMPAVVQHSVSMIDNMSDAASEREDESGIESSAPDPADNTVFIRIGVPELKVQVTVGKTFGLFCAFDENHPRCAECNLLVLGQENGPRGSVHFASFVCLKRKTEQLLGNCFLSSSNRVK